MTKGTVLVLCGPDYEDLEVWYPRLRLQEAGYDAPLAGLGDKSYRGKYGYPATMDGHVRDFLPESLAGVVAPGGWAPDKLRRDKDVLTLVRAVHAVCAAIMFFLTWQIWLKAGKISGYADTTDVLRIPVGPFVYFMTFTIGLTGLVHVYKIFRPGDGAASQATT